ncbi:hypothetical protein [Rhizobium sullae]|uniref:hypothetical protein n=1 Tax=Rhizobium sullae TaxID=50338 RepID=UPI003CC7FDAD
MVNRNLDLDAAVILDRHRLRDVGIDGPCGQNGQDPEDSCDLAGCRRGDLLQKNLANALILKEDYFNPIHSSRRLVSVKTDGAAGVQLREMKTDHGIMVMRELKTVSPFRQTPPSN